MIETNSLIETKQRNSGQEMQSKDSLMTAKNLQEGLADTGEVLHHFIVQFQCIDKVYMDESLDKRKKPTVSSQMKYENRHLNKPYMLLIKRFFAHNHQIYLEKCSSLVFCSRPSGLIEKCILINLSITVQILN